MLRDPAHHINTFTVPCVRLLPTVTATRTSVQYLPCSFSPQSGKENKNTYGVTPQKCPMYS
jgi:hypothetical protein